MCAQQVQQRAREHQGGEGRGRLAGSRTESQLLSLARSRTPDSNQAAGLHQPLHYGLNSWGESLPKLGGHLVKLGRFSLIPFFLSFPEADHFKERAFRWTGSSTATRPPVAVERKQLLECRAVFPAAPNGLKSPGNHRCVTALARQHACDSAVKHLQPGHF